MENFKVVEVNAYSKEEAKKIAKEQHGIEILKEATQAWTKANKPISEKTLREFCGNHLQGVTKFVSGIGCLITVESGVADTRERPYTVHPIKNEQGKRKFKKAYQAIDKATGEILFTSFGTKKEAEDMGKDLYISKNYRGDIFCKVIHEVIEGEVGAFEMTYTPSKNTKLGTYIVFGVQA